MVLPQRRGGAEKRKGFTGFRPPKAPRPLDKTWEKMHNGMPMNGLIILFFYQKKRITEQVRNDDAMENQSWCPENNRDK